MPKDFWVIEKDLVKKCENLSFSQVSKFVSRHCLENVPQVYDFNIRAKVFTYFLDQTKAAVNHGDYYGAHVNIQARRDYILEDAFAATVAKGVDWTHRFQVQFVD